VANATAGNWRLQKAGRFMTAATRALAGGDLETAVSRAYYARFHACIALLESRSVASPRRRWDHDQVRTQFRSHFGNAGYHFTRRDADDMDKLYEDRLQADYGREPLRSRDVVARIESTQAFLERAREVVADA
jgi:uncharacterized protein (UPF0332 family)